MGKLERYQTQGVDASGQGALNQGVSYAGGKEGALQGQVCSGTRGKGNEAKRDCHGKQAVSVAVPGSPEAARTLAGKQIIFAGEAPGSLEVAVEVK